MAVIREDDFIQSVADALQFISYYHPLDYIEHLGRAYEREQSPAAKDAIAQILTNSRMCAEGRRPICQDTGIVNLFLKVGMDVRWDARRSLADMINEGVRRAYNHPDNKLRASVVDDPLFARKNTRDNTPAVFHVELVPGGEVEVNVAAKGGGSENKSKFVMLNPSDSIVDWVLKTVPTMGAGWCPPGMLGLGVGGTAEKAMLMAKESLMEPLDMHELLARGPQGPAEELRVELYEKINALGIGAQGLGGLTTILDVKLRMYPTHAASKPVAMIPNCAATRHAHFVLDGSGPAVLEPPSLESWPKVTWTAGGDSRRVNLDALTRAEVASWKPGETLLLNGKMLTGRDAAHKRIADLFASGQGLPPGVDFTNRVIYYVGPVDPVRDEVVGPAGPTTATRMDKFTDMMLEKTGLIAMVGKSERGPAAIESIRKHQAAYLMAVGGAAYLVSKAIRSSRVVAFAELGMEAIYEFDVKDMPVTVAVDALGTSVHNTAPAQWAEKIRTLGIPRPGRLTPVAAVDTLRRFVFERYPFRGQLVHLGPAWKAMMEHHDYPAQVRDTLGEAVAAAALLSSTLKYSGLLSLQLRGTGPMHLMLVECSDGLAMRAVARFRDPPDTRDLRVLSGGGTLTVTVEGENAAHRYQGIVPLTGAAMSDCLREYFETSEQLPTRLWLHADAEGASGLLLQRLPLQVKPSAVLESGAGAIPADEVEDAWRRVQLVAGTVTNAELGQLDDSELLRRLFAEDDVRVFEPAPVYFRCRCSRERVENMLRALGREEVASVVAEFGQVEVRCEFCSRVHRLDAVDCAALFNRPGAPAPGTH